MNYKGYEGLTQEQIKEKIIVDYYTTGGVNGRKINNKKQNGEIELKKHAERSLTMYHGIRDPSEYVDDLYQTVFEYLWNHYTPETFCETFFKDDGEFNYQRFFATAGNILRWEGTGKGTRPGHSFMTAIMYASSANEGNFSFDKEVEGYGSLIETIDLKQSLDNDFDIDENEVTVTQLLSYLTESELHIFNERLKKKGDRAEGFSLKDYRFVAAKLMRIHEYLNGLRDTIDIVKEVKPIVIKEKKTKVAKVKKQAKRRALRVNQLTIPPTENFFDACTNGKKYVSLLSYLQSTRREIEQLPEVNNEHYKYLSAKADLLSEKIRIHRLVVATNSRLKNRLFLQSATTLQIENEKQNLIELQEKEFKINEELKPYNIEHYSLPHESEYMRTGKKKFNGRKPVEYKKLFIRKSGNIRYTREEQITRVEDELMTLPKASKRYEAVKQMLMLLMEEGALLQREASIRAKLCLQSSLSSIQIEILRDEQSTINHRRVDIEAELKKLEDDRKRIILSDVTNGGSI